MSGLGLLSQPSGVQTSAGSDVHFQPGRPASSSAFTPLLRKRCFTDLATGFSPKRPRRQPRVHTVSDPIFNSSLCEHNGLDEWFSDNFRGLFDMPPPVDSSEFDQKTDWEIHLFDDYNFPDGSRKISSPNCACFYLLFVHNF